MTETRLELITQKQQGQTHITQAVKATNLENEIIENGEPTRIIIYEPKTRNIQDIYTLIGYQESKNGKHALYNDRQGNTKSLKTIIEQIKAK